MNDVTTSGALSPASYQDFIASKLSLHVPVGFAPSDLSRYGLFDFQSAIVDWAVKRGRAAIFADTGLGKALDSKTNVITPYGYQPIGSLKPGDFVIGSNGKPTKVIGVFPQGIRPSYKVTFSDETSVICDIEHLWAVRTKTDASRGNAWKILTLKQIMDIGLGGGGGERQNRWFIPSLDSPAEFIEGDLPIHPYVLGALLGDGHIRGGKVSISSADEDIINRVNDLLPNGYHAIKRRYSKYDYDIAKIDYDTGMTGNNKPHHISDVLKEIGVYGLLSLDKFIPDVYKFSNTDTRLEILRGLFDTDGSVWMTRKCPVVEFSTSSYRLACDVQFIIQSLGGKTKIKRRSTKCNDSYRLIPSFPLGINPFYLPRKANLYKGPQKYLPRRSIRNIERIGYTDMTCIKVDAEDELFVVENFIVTHNTRMQLAWADQVATFTGKPVLILAPLCVAQQTVREAESIGIADCRYARTKALVLGARIVVVNYEMLEHFSGIEWGGVVLDESSILKSFEGKTRNALISQFAGVDYRLSCTATPSPNDFMELGNQAEFLGVMSRTEMLAQFFIHDGGDTSQWRLKGHGKTVFWQWMSTWAVCIRSPADLGFDGSRYILPPLQTHQHTVDAPFVPSDQLFSTVALTLNDRRAAKRVSIEHRVKAAADLVNGNAEKWIVWCHLNDESAALTKAIPDAIEVTGSMSSAEKEKRIMAFINSESRVIVSKSSIMGFGLNLQLCAHMAFVGLDDSYEAYYQAVRRCYRFGQTRPVEVHIISSEGEGAILKNIERKAAQAQEMSAAMVGHMREFSQREIQGAHRETNDYERDIAGDEDWTLHLGDCVDVVSEMESNSIGYTVFSPPFASLYTYSNSHRDMGNCRSHTDFYQHFRFLVDELLRVTKDGRLLSFHCTNIPMMKGRDGQIGIHDFRGELIKLFVDAGWIFHSEVVIWKDPVTAMQRTKALGLLYTQLRKDSCMSRMGIPDYLVTMRKPGVNPEPVTKTHDGFPVSLWQQYASPVWMDVNPTRTLQYRAARDNDDERHICLAAGSLVLTREYGYIEIEDVEPGDHVLTHQGRWMPVLAKRCNGIAETIRVCAQGVADLTVTPDHQLWTRRSSGARAKESARNNTPEWIESQDTLGSYLNLKLPPEEPNELTNDEWWIIGRWLGDGHRGTRRTSGVRGAGFGEFIISCNHDEADDLVDRLYGHVGYLALRTATQITLKGLRREVRKVLNQCGQGAGNKRLPGEAFTLSKEKSQSLLDGYLSADGHYVEKHDRHCASSISRALLLGMAMVAQRAYGVVVSVYAGRPDRQGEIEGRSVNMRQDWIFAFRMSEGYKKSGWIGDDGAWKKVRKIECADEREVWDLQVAEDASFTAEGCIVHNCPLQLDVIERAIELWSNPGDLVLSPFAGIGSEGFVALQMGRRFVGAELKRSYFEVACRNLAAAKSMQGGLFAGHEEQINAAA